MEDDNEDFDFDLDIVVAWVVHTIQYQSDNWYRMNTLKKVQLDRLCVVSLITATPIKATLCIM